MRKRGLIIALVLMLGAALLLGTALMPVTAGTKINYMAYLVGDKLIRVVDLTNFKVVGKIPIGAPGSDMVFLPEESTAYISHPSTGTLSIMNVPKRKIVKKLKVGDTCNDMAVTRTGKELFVSNLNGKNSLGVFDTLTMKMMGKVLVGRDPRRMAISQDDKTAYVINSGDRTVSSVRMSDRKIMGSVPVGYNPVDIKVSPDNDMLLVSCLNSDDLYVFDVKDLKLKKRIANLGKPWGIAFSPWSNYVYLACYGSGNIKVIDLKTWKIVREIALSGRPMFIQLRPDGDHMIVALEGGKLQSVRLTDFRVEKKLLVQEAINAMVVGR